MDIIITILAFLVLIGIVVAIHEGGHFFTALACKMRVLEFSLGFGPQLLQKEFGKDKIKFTLRALPLGGFVKPLDESTVTKEEWDAMSESEKTRSFRNAPKWKKALMVAGGPFANFVLAFFIYVYISMFMGSFGVAPRIAEILPNSFMAKAGAMEQDLIQQVDGRNVYFTFDAHSQLVSAAISQKNTTMLVNRSGQQEIIPLNFQEINLKELKDDFAQLSGMYFQGVSGDLMVKSVLPNMPLEAAGVMVGSQILAINSTPVTDLNKLLREIRLNPNTMITLTIKNPNGTIEDKALTPFADKQKGKEVGKIGVEMEVLNQQGLITRNYTILESFEESIFKVNTGVVTTLVSLKKIITGDISIKALSGPLTIADYSGRSAKKGLTSFLLMMAAISIAVGVFNLLPIPLFDGGHLMQYAIETIRNKDFTEKELKLSMYIGYCAIATLFSVALINDFSKYLTYIL